MSKHNLAEDGKIIKSIHSRSTPMTQLRFLMLKLTPLNLVEDFNAPVNYSLE
jgi:hypothetical protein